MDLKHRWRSIRRRIVQAAHRVDRDPNEIQVVTVTKYLDVEQTKEILDLGLDHIGENRTNQALAKWETLGDRGVWHFIGRLQRRKVKDILNRFTYLHSLDRMSLAQEIEKRSSVLEAPLKCFIQVNVSGEATKTGISPQELKDFSMEVANLSSIDIVGLMTMAPKTDHPEEVRPIFRELRRLQKELQQLNHPRLTVPHLSMGMSQDFEVAIEEGATWIRLGSILVGERSV